MKKITLFLFALFTCWQINAQVSAYSFSETTETYAQITGTTSTATGDDGEQNAIPIGFSFNFGGTSYTTFSISTNGIIKLGGNIVDGTDNHWTNILTNGAQVNKPLIAVLWDDNNLSTGTIRYSLTGTAPNQVLSVNWHDTKIGSTGSTGGAAVSAVLRLYETTNIIEIIYSSPFTTTNTVTGSVGLMDTTSFLSVTPAATSTVSSATANNTISAAVMANLAGKKLVFTPPVPCSGAPVAGTVTPALQNVCPGVVPANLVGSGYSSGVTGLTFQWEESNDDGATDAWAPAVGGTGATTATYTPPAFSGTTIYYRLSVICANASTSAQTASVMVTVPVIPTNQITSLTIPAATVGAGQAVINWTNGNGGRRVVYISDSATFTDPVDGNAPALDANNVYAGSGQQIIFDGTAATVTVTGLMPGTQYYIKAYEYVRCGSGPYDYYYNVTTGTNTGNFTTCPAFTVPYFEGFESGYTHNVAVAGCLSQVSVTGTQVWTANSTFTDYGRTPRTGSYNAFLRWSNEDWLFIPVSLVGGTSYRVSLYARQDGATATDSNIAISYGTSSSVAGMTNAIVAATGIINGNYQEIVGDFTPATSGTYYVGIKGYMNGAPLYISLDDISITESPSCLEPNTILATATSNTVDLSWTDGSGGLQFDYEYVIQAPGTGEPTGAGAPVGDVSVIGEGFDIDGNPLTPNTLYEVYVRAVCNGGSDFSTWSGPITFRTLCDAITVLPHAESFDAVANPSCWSTALITGTTNWAPDDTNDGVPSARTGARFAGKSWLGDDNALLISPPYDLSAYSTDQARLNVWIYRSANGLATDRVTFYANTANNLTGATMLVDVPLPITSAPTVASAGWYNYTVDVPLSYNAGGVFYIIAQGRTSSSWSSYSVGFDDYVLELTPTTAPSCATNVVATPHPTCGNYANSITWDVTSGAEGYYVTIGTTTGGINIADAIPVSGTSYNFTGNFDTTYFYTIVPFNANGSATGCTEQSFATNVNGCYCVSAPTSVDGSGITNVQIVSTDFPNTVSTSPVYNDHTATPVDMTQGINNNVQITFNVPSFGSNSYDYNTVIWIDANDDYVLDASEIVYTGLSATTAAPTLLNASFVMPGTMPLGQHRMRIVATDALQTPANPCYSGTYGETADFTVNIVAASCTPPAATTTVVPACGTAQYSIDVNVTALGSGTPSITDGTTTWPVSAIGVVNVGPFASGSSVTLTLLHGSDATCNLPLGNFVYNCPPTNDDLCNAIPLVVNAISTGTQYNNIGATSETNEPIASCFEDGINGSVWFSFVAPASGEVIITTDIAGASATDTEIALYDATGVTCSDLSTLGAPIGCDQDGGTTIIFNSILVQAGLTPGTTYYIQVDDYGYGTDQGTFGIEVQEVLSSDLFDNNNFMAYPNPVKDVLNVSYTSEISSIRVINMIGQEVISKNINATSTQVDMSHLSAGTYIVNVTVGDNVKTLKVVKQ